MLPLRLYRTMLWCFPASFRAEYGREMLTAFADQLRAARQGGRRAEVSVWLRTVIDLLLTAVGEHCHVIQQNLRYAVRTLASQPVFTTAAILSLALGIGANTAIFSLLDNVVLSGLPVPDAHSLVMLTNPTASGVAVGSQGGERALLSYPEFQEMRKHSAVFSGLMACESSLDHLPARLDGGDTEQVSARMVSAEYFDVLRVPAMLGRTFSAGDEPAAPNAVISFHYWQHRFGRRADVLGSKIELGRGVFSIIGVAPEYFFGETIGQRPDVWLPLGLQPLVLPGRDWLHDTPGRIDKVMWLHVFGRLKPGVPMATAEAGVNTTFRQGLASYYGSVLAPELRKDFLNQRLRLRPAATGASQIRERFAEPLTVLLAAAGLVLLIACANLGNLLLARAITRTREIAVRLALGAGTGHLVRQLLTESLVLAVAGGIAGLLTASILRVTLLRLASDSVDLPGNMDFRVLGFAFVLTIAAGLILGLLPALWTMSMRPAAGLLEHGRRLTASSAWLRAGKLVVVGQLALSVPLLVGAALLIGTLNNLRNVDLGYAKERLLVMEVDAETAGYGETRRLALFRRLLERVRAVPGVEAATFSNNGLFSGSDSGDEIAVEGYTATGRNDKGSRYNHVGPNYFSTLGIPLLLGREITEQDDASTPRVCVTNQAFARRFFAGRNPLGMHITQIYGNQRNTCAIVGVARDSRAGNLRGEVEHRFYVPASQPIFALDSASFAIRTAAKPSSLVESLRRAILSVDRNLPVTVARTVVDLVDERIVQDRLLARLSVAFGVVALLLAAIGLYGVLSYAVARRTNEIGIRKALGAHQRTVLAMILRETGVLLVIALALGMGLSAMGLRLIASRLYGLAATNATALATAVGVLAAVGLIAACVPAYRAARVDPLIALRYE